MKNVSKDELNDMIWNDINSEDRELIESFLFMLNNNYFDELEEWYNVRVI